MPENTTFTTSDSDVAVSMNLNDFVTAIRNIWGWSADDIKNMLNSNNYWQMDYDVDNSAITRLYWGATGDLQGYPDVMSAFSVTYTGSQTGTINNIDLTSSYTPAYQEVLNPSWDRIDVQPGGGSLPSQTGNSGKFLITNGTNASWANVVIVPATTPTLVVADWSSNTQTIMVTGVTASNVVLVSPAPSSASDYASAGIICTAQGTDSLTFTCDTVPTNAIDLSVVILSRSNKMAIIQPVIKGGGTAPVETFNTKKRKLDANGKIVIDNTATTFSTSPATDVGDEAFKEAFYGSQVTALDCSSLTTVSGSEAFALACSYTNVSSAVFTNLAIITGYNAFASFAEGSGITSLSFPALTQISAYCFNSCFAASGITSVTFGGTQEIQLGVDCFESMFLDCEEDIDVYAPAANQSEIEAMSGYPEFGGLGTVTWHWNS